MAGMMERMDGGWERRNGGLFLHPHRSMREAAQDPPSEPEEDEDDPGPLTASTG